MGILAAFAAVLKGGPFVMLPPKQYQGDNMVAVCFHNPDSLAKVCKGGSTIGEPGGVIVACFKDHVLHLPNPNGWSDPYAQIVAHELGHANGWPSDHPKK